MTSVTNAERFGFRRGIEQGVTQGERSLILRQLTPVGSRILMSAQELKA